MKSTTKKPEIVSGKFYVAETANTREGFLVRLPNSVAEILESQGNKVLWTVVNGVIQLSSPSQPQVAIPPAGISVDNFTPQETPEETTAIAGHFPQNDE